MRAGFGNGRVRTIHRKVGSEAAGNADFLQLNSMVAVGGTDVAAPKVAADVPTSRQDAEQLISFNGTITDLAPSSLSAVQYPTTLRRFVDGLEMVSDLNAEDPSLADFTYSIGEPDHYGKCIYTITNLILTGDDTGHDVMIGSVDPSGNVRKVETQFASVRSGRGIEGGRQADDGPSGRGARNEDRHAEPGREIGRALDRGDAKP